MTPDPFNSMRWEHVWGFGTVLGAIGLVWHWANKHVKYFKAKLNGYTVEKKEKL